MGNMIQKEQKKPMDPIGVADEEQAQAREMCDQAYGEEQMRYIPPEFVGCLGNDSEILYHCYLIELQPDFDSPIVPHDILLATRTRIEFDDETSKFELNVDRGSLKIVIKYVRHIKLTSEEVLLCQKFQVTLFRLLLDKNKNKLHEALCGSIQNSEYDVFDYLLIPSTGSREDPPVDWKCVKSVLFPDDNISNKNTDCSSNRGHDSYFHTKDGLVCSCTLENCLVVTPHSSKLYCITGVLKDMNSNSLLKPRNRGSLTYKANFEKQHGIKLSFERESLLEGKHLFRVQNYLLGCRNQKTKGSRYASYELPPELCEVIMSPISIASILSFSYAPSIIRRLESFLIAGNLKRMLMDHCRQNYVIPTIKVLEAITTQNCQENYNLTSLATLGDSFLKYAASQKLFNTHQNYDKGLLTEERKKIISNPALCKLGYEKKISGFIRDERFDPKIWIIPGDKSRTYILEKELLSPRSIVYGGEKRKIEIKTVADVIEALIGAFLCTVGELAASAFMEWVGIKVDFGYVPYLRPPLPTNPEKLVDLKFFESLLNKYSFRDASLLVEALTHGSYKRPENPRCYKRLEFLGDAVLDYLITRYLYNKHPNLSSGLLTDLRSASVNNDFYARTAIKVGLHEHILHDSKDLGRRIASAVNNFKQSSRISIFGWKSEEVIKVLADMIESLAGAIYVDSGYDKEVVFQSIKPLLEPLVTPETIKLQPVRELNELCDKNHFVLEKDITYDNGETSIKLTVDVNGAIYICQRSAANRETAEKSASMDMLEKLKIT